MTTKYLGTCFCGAVEVEVEGEPLEMGYCHCQSCRTYSGSPLTAFTLWRDQNFQVLRGREHLGSYNKTGTSNRRYCTRCGGHLFTEHPGFGFTDVYAAAFKDLVFRPALHLNYAESVLRIADGLPKFCDFPVEAGGTGQLMSE
jgi:hypothetical protein